MIEENDMNRLLGMAKKHNAKKIFVQVPEGLKMEINKMSSFFSKNGIDTIFSAEPCFGACDLRDHEAEMFGCDMLIHIGHADFGVRHDMPVIYYELRKKYDFIRILEKNMGNLEKYKSIGLMTTVQFVDEIASVKGYLEKKGKDVFVGKNKKTGYFGHILGCDYSAITGIEDRVDCFLYFGSGRFHPYGFSTEKPVLSLDMEGLGIINMTEEMRKLKIKRELAIEKARTLENFAIYVSAKPGQSRTSVAMEIKRTLEKEGKSAVILSADTLTAEKLIGIKADVIVNTACPRIRDDSELFGKIILNPEDIRKLQD